MVEYFKESAERAMPKPTGTAHDIQTLADELDSLGRRLANTQILTEGRPLDDWFGEAANSYASEVSGLREIIQDAVDIHADLKTNLENYQSAFKTFVDTTLPQHHADWENLQNSASSLIGDVNSEWNELKRQEAAGHICVDHESFRQEIARIKQETREAQIEVLTNFVSSSNSLAGEASSAASAIAGALDSFIPPEVAGQAGSGDVGKYLFDDLPFLSSHALREDGLYDGERAADFLNDPSNYDEWGYLTEEALNTYMQEFGGRGGDDPFFAHALVDQLGSEKILALAASWESGMHVPSHEYPERMREFLTDLGAATMVSTGSTRDPSVSDAWGAWELQADNISLGGVKGQDALVQERLDDLATAMGHYYTYNGEISTNDYEGFGGHMYLGQLLGAAGHEYSDLALSDAFLNGSATVTAPDGSTSQIKSVAHGMVEADYHHPYGYQHIDFGGAWGPDHTSDPIVNLLSVMDGNPDAVREFLASDPTFDYIEGDANGNESMTRYLVSHRPYFNSHFAAAWPDGGDQLGLVIDEVTSTPDARHHVETFGVLDGFLHGYTDALQSHGTVNNWIFDRDDNGQSKWGFEHQALRHRAGDILAEYAPDLAHEMVRPTGVRGGDGVATVFAGETGTSADGEQSFRLLLSDELRNVITDREKGLFLDLAYDSPLHERQHNDAYFEAVGDSALAKISLSAATSMESEFIAAYSDGNSDYLADVATDYGSLLANLEFADFYAQEQSGAATDARNSVVKSSLKFVASATPLSGIDGFSDLGDSTKGVANHLRSNAEGQIYSTFLSEGHAEAARSETGGEVEFITGDILDLVNKSSIVAQNADGPQPAAVIERYENSGQYSILDDDGYIIEWEDMTSQQRSQYEEFIEDHNNEAATMLSQARRDVPGAIRDAFAESSNAEE